MAESNSLPTFYGDERDVKHGNSAEEWARMFKVRSRDLGRDKDAQRIEDVGDHFATRSPAAKWYAEHQAGQNAATTWAGFVTAFTAQFPAEDQAEPSPEEYQQRLVEARIQLEDLNTTVGEPGAEVYAYVKFAARLLDLARKGGVKDTSSYIGIVRKNLPEPLRKRISATPKDWVAFTNEIKKVDRVVLLEDVETAKEQKEREAAIEKRLASAEKQMPMTPVSKMASRLSSTVLNTPRSSNTGSSSTTGRDLFAASGGGQGSIRFARVESLSEDGMKKLRALVDRAQPPPNTAQGRDLYRRQMEAWTLQYGALGSRRPPLEEIGYPLTPGTALLCSGECFTCGQLTAPPHRKPDCKAEPVPREEGSFRAACMRHLGRVRAPPANSAIAVNYLDLTLADSDDEEDFQSGLSL
uniref:Retrotransposon gag domain-containing protein n=1 Tax=Mycena chlorophos TaxID=658473 RepID=A0ABQ0KV50_MYCCL|nr:predicted protein [Mycena chlorophos]